MAKKAAKATPKTIEPAEKPETATVSKSQAAREALAAGLEGPQDAIAFIKKKFGIDMRPEHFSAVKAQEKKKSGITPLKRGPRPKAAAEGYLALPKIVPTGEGDLLDALKAMKPLIAQYGPEKVKEMVDLLG
jgi:hypothetical protein